ncbi:MAG TPA: GNAT family N-acetyltransferase [Thermoleophilia bacterium]
MPLPAGYIVRHPTEADLPAAQAVLDAAESHDAGEARAHDDELATDWKDPESHPKTDWWVIVGPADSIVAVGWLRPETAGEITADFYVRPEHRGLALGDVLLDLIVARAAQLPSRRPDGAVRRLVAWSEDHDHVRRAALDGRGFQPVRQFYEMAMDLDEEPAPAQWSPGVTPRSFRPGLDEQYVWEADGEAFSEHYLYQLRPFEEWRLHHLETADADPTLWWLAWDGEELAGYVTAVCGEHGAVVGDLAVRKPWRGRGIGRALLLAAFQTLRERGQSVVRLMVDAQNVTNAVRVYEAAGMHVSRRFDVMEKPLG